MDEVQAISWTVGGEEPRPRSIDWYWGLGVLAFAGAGASLFFGNFLFAIIIVIGAVCAGFLAVRGPRGHTVSVGPRGISIDGTRYPYDSVYSFWVEREANPPHLFLSMHGIIAPHYSFPLIDSAQGEQVRETLKRFVAEEEQGPRVGDRLAEIFGL
ncbi:MAG: hypothetical protein KBD50_03235 [Candidatus Pacebacteria bacterium]|nr:hypothetical protein [Candidatus Paceibacterota bacterium]